MQAASLKLSDRVLGLHRSIRTVLVTREEAGEWKVIEESIKSGIRPLEEDREVAKARYAIAPAVMIGAANGIKGRAGQPQIVGILYEKVAAIFAPLDPQNDRILCVTAEHDALEEALQAIRKALPDIKKGS